MNIEKIYKFTGISKEEITNFSENVQFEEREPQKTTFRSHFYVRSSRISSLSFDGRDVPRVAK